MLSAKADILARLRMDILIRQGLQKLPGSRNMDMGLGILQYAFPDQVFPLAAIHEFICTGQENKTASAGFIAGLLSVFMKQGGICLWLSPNRNCYPPSFVSFGIDPARIIFVDLPREKELYWALEEALKCDGLCAVVAEVRNLDFTISRRLQLAVEQSRVTGFLIRQTSHTVTTACVSRWRITSLPSHTPRGMPGVGFPRWNVELLKIRNGWPGRWQLEWRNNTFNAIVEEKQVLQAPQRKIV